MKYYQSLTKIFTVLFIVFVLGLIVTDAQPSIYTIQDGTRIKVRMDNEINSKASGINDTFTASVSRPVLVRDVEIIPVGSIVEGRVVDVRAASAGRKDGHLEVKFERLILPDEVIRFIDASLVNQDLAGERSSSIKDLAVVGGIAIGAVLGALTGRTRGAIVGAGVGAGVGTIVPLLGKGNEARIRANEEFEISLNKAVTVPAKDY